MSTPQQTTPDLTPGEAHRPAPASFERDVLRTPRRTSPAPAGHQHARRGAWWSWRGASDLLARSRVLTVAVAVLLAGLGVLRVLVPLAIGLADNGEGRAVACALDVAPVADGPRYFSFAILEWARADESCAGTSGPHVALLTVAGWLSAPSGVGLDLRVAAVAYCVLAACAAAVVGHLARGRRHGRAVATALTWVVLLDAAFVGYSASLYPQAAALAGLVLCLTGWVLLDAEGRARWVGRGAVLAGGALLVSSGPVMATAVVPLLAMLGWRAVRAARPARVGEHRGAGAWAVPAVLAALLVVPAALGVTSATAEQRKNNAWEMVSVGLLADAADPGAELESMGLPAEVERFVGTPVWAPSSIRGWSGWADLEIEQAAVLGYLATHPSLVYERLDATVHGVVDGRPAGLGSYTADSGEPAGAQETRLTLFSTFQGAFLGLGAPAVLLGWGFLVWVGVASVRLHGAGERGRRLAEGALLALGVAATQVVAVMLTEATDVSRHVVVGSLAGGLALCLLVASGLAPREDERVPVGRGGRGAVTGGDR